MKLSKKGKFWEKEKDPNRESVYLVQKGGLRTRNAGLGAEKCQELDSL